MGRVCVSEKKILNCFKTYDVRGKLGEEINEDIAYESEELRQILWVLGK